MIRALRIGWITLTLAAAAAPAFAVSAPTNLTAQTMSSSGIALAWSSNDTSVTGFVVERSLDSQKGFKQIAAPPVGSRTYQDGGLVGSTVYYYRMRAVSGSTMSVRTSVVNAQTMPPGAPILPTRTATPVPTVTATPKPTATATRTATAVATLTATVTALPTLTATVTPLPTVTSTPIPTKTATATPQPTLTATPVPTRTATATPLPTTTATATPVPTLTATVTPLPTLTATVTAHPTTTATATPVPTVTATPDGSAPSIPGGLGASAGSCTQVTVSWNASTDTGGSGLEGYTVYRNGNAVQHVAAPTTSATDAGLAGGTVYTYTVRAADNAGNMSNPSAGVSVNTPSCNQAPTASARVTDVSGMVASFTGAGSSDTDGTITSYAWTFGDGASGNGMTASHTYAAAGVYTATLTITDNGGASASNQTSVTISDASGATGQVVWQQARGGTGADVSRALAVDGGGNIVVVGNFTGVTNFGFGLFPSAGSGDAIVARYSSAGLPLWARTIGGTANDTAYAVAIDRTTNCDGAGGSDCVLVAGNFGASIDIGTGPLVSAGGADIFVAKYSSGGTPLWARRFGGTADDSAYGIAVDASGNVVVTGYFTGSTDFGGGTLYSPYFDEDTFALKLSPAGGYLWARNFSNTSRDIGQAVALTTGGDVVVAGWNLGAFEGTQSRGKEDIFVVRLASATGAKIWGQRFGGNGTDQAFGVAVDNADDIVVTGTMQGPVDFGGGVITPTGADIFLLELTGNGAYRWAKHFGGFYDFVNCGMAVATDTAGNVVVSGIFEGTADFGTGVLTTVNGTSDAFMAKYTASGNALWAKRFGTGGTEYATDVAVDPTNNGVVVTGAFNGIINLGLGNLLPAGTYDVFLGRFTP